MKYSVTWKDLSGASHSQLFDASCATAAIALAMEKIELLRNHPHLIYRVPREES